MTLFTYRDSDFHLHHTITPHPDPLGFSTHMHTGCELFFFLSGEGHYLIEGNEIPLAPGVVLLMRPGELHRICISSTLPYERVVINFPPEALEGIDPDGRLCALFFDRPLGQGNAYYGDEESRAFMTSCIYRLARVGENGRVQRLAFLLPILAELCEQQSTQVVSAADRLVAEVISYINAHLFEDWTIDDLATRFFFSRTHLSRVFRATTGLSVWDYTLLKRLIAAREEIRRGTPATVAASRCGFGDYSSFWRQYKRRFGMSPSEGA